MTEQFGKASWYLSSTILSTAIPIVTLPVLTRWLRPEDFGVLALGYVVALLFKGFANLGVTTGLERNFFAYESDRLQLGRLMHSGLVTVLLSACCWAGLFFVARGRVSWLLFGEPGWGTLIWVMSCASAIGVLMTIQLTYLRNAGRARGYLFYSVGGGVLEAVLSVSLVVIGKLGVWGVVLAQLIGKCAVLMLAWWRLTQELPLRLDRRMSWELLTIGLPVTPKAFVGVADAGIDRLLIKWLNSLGQVGLFGIAYRIGYAVFEFLTSLEHVYLPELFRAMFRDGERGGTRLGELLTPYLYASLLVPVLVVLFIEEALWVLVTPAYYEVKGLVAVLATHYGQMVFGKIVGAQLLYRKKTWYATPLGLLRLSIHVGCAFLWIPSFGAFGAALALLVSGLVVEALAVWIAQREYRIAYEASHVVPALLLLYGSMGWTLLPAVVSMPYWLILVGKFAWLGAFFGIMWRWARTRGVLPWHSSQTIAQMERSDAGQLPVDQPAQASAEAVSPQPEAGRA